MKNKEKNYLFLILVHVVLGLVIYGAPLISKVYGIAIFIVSIYFIIKTRNRNNEVLYAAAYVVGSEVFLRMTNGNPNHEFSKYSVIIYMLIGMVYSGLSKNAVPYWIYLLLLLPGVFIATQSIGLDAPNIRKTIMFNISGPLCLGFAALYCYNRRITIDEMNNLMLLIGLPLVACSVYLMLYTPDIKFVLTNGNSSNSESSGGYGPNQVATAMGLGMFIFFSRILLVSRTKILLFVNIIILLTMTYRGLITFSRGGVITGFFMILILLLLIYFNSKNMGKLKLIYILGFMVSLLIVTWTFTETRTEGLMSKRYTNRDALGRVKESNFTGREELVEGELEMFLDSPFFGVGTGKGTEIRTKQFGVVTASHNEMTRMLGEHGALGILALVILFLTPIFLFLDNKQHVYLFCFLFFWLLTINHAAMRTAAPSFVYALALLKVRFNNENQPTVHRE